MLGNIPPLRWEQAGELYAFLFSRALGRTSYVRVRLGSAIRVAEEWLPQLGRDWESCSGVQGLRVVGGHTRAWKCREVLWLRCMEGGVEKREVHL